METEKKPITEFKFIDFHTHIFPEVVAQKATDHVGAYYSLPMMGNGTEESLMFGQKDLNVAGFVMFSAAMNPLKTRSVNDFVKDRSANNPKIIGFASVHPDTPDLEGELNYILSMNFHGLKLHPDFQQFNIDDERMYPVYDKLSGKLPILFHVGDQNSDMSSPKRLAKVMKLFPELTVIAAHMGGYSTWDLAEEYLVGTRAYFDTSNALLYIPDDELVSIIRRHGSEKIFFGSDFPLRYTADAAREFYRIHLSEKEFDDIFYNNAKKFLRLV